MRLIIAEKPSVAETIAAVIATHRTKRQGYIEIDNGNCITWCFGHLFEQCEPDEYLPEDVPRSQKSGKKIWRLEDLPIIPEQWKLVAKTDCKAQIAVIAKLLKAASEVIHAGDPDREGQLLVDEVLETLHYRGPIKRVWLQDLSEAGIRKAFAQIKDNAHYRGLRDAALARARADWLVGMNLTRAYTLIGRGHKGVLSIGRVQTPTLALVVARDREIEQFTPKPYYEVLAHFQAAKGDYWGQWQVPEAYADAEGRCLDRAKAQAVAQAIQGKPGRVEEAKKERCQEPPPLPFSLSKLQQLASAKYGMKAQQVLDIAQSLYEKHKLITYPRTDCEYLAENQHADAPAILAAVSENLPQMQELIRNGADTRRKSRAFNDKKIGAHTGIIPTSTRADVSRLTQDEQRIYEAVARRYIAQFFPPHEYESMRVLTSCQEQTFLSTGRRTIHPGWREVYRMANKEMVLPELEAGHAVRCLEAQIEDKMTRPPERFTEGTLIQAMAGIAKFIEDEQAKKILRETTGLGTEATRAGIIETLKQRGFLAPQGKHLISTELGRQFIDAIPSAVKDPVLTAKWEQALANIESQHIDKERFLGSLQNWIIRQVEEAKSGQIQITITASVDPKPANAPKSSRNASRTKTRSRGSSPQEKPRTTRTTA